MTRIAKRWYHIVSSDNAKVVDALKWYLSELDEGFNKTDISGSLMRANQTQPGFVAYYDSMHTDLDAILELFERLRRTRRGQVLKEFADNPPTNTKLTANDIKALADCDQTVEMYDQIILDVQYVYKQFGALLKSLEQRGYSLNSVTKLRVAGLEEVQV